MSNEITIDDLAGTVKIGFDDMTQRFRDVDKRFDDTHAYMNKRFDDMDKRFDRIENFLLKRHEQEIEQLKVRMRYIEDMLAVLLKK